MNANAVWGLAMGLILAWTIILIVLYALCWQQREAAERSFWEAYDD